MMSTKRLRRTGYVATIGLALALAGAAAHAGSIEPMPKWNEEPSLVELLGKLGVNPETTALADGRDAVWSLDRKASIALAFEYTDDARKNSFGIYDINDPGRRIELFSGRDGANTTARVWFVPDATGGYQVRVRGGSAYDHATLSAAQFGFYLTNSNGGGRTYFSDTRLNGDGLDHLQAYFHEGAGVSGKDKKRSNGMGPGYILAWEDTFGGGDRDYQDMAVSLHDFSPVPLPPAFAMALAGLVLVGAAGWRRRHET